LNGEDSLMAQPSTASIWSAMRGDLWRFIRHRVHDDHAADDLLQETFVRIHRGIGNLRDADRLTPWLYQVARNVIIDHYRHDAGNAVALEVEVADQADAAPACSCRSLPWLEEMIQQLPERYRQAIQLAEIEGLTQQEVADRLGLSLSGAKSRVQRGRTLLKGVLEQCCTFHFDRRGNLLDYDPKPERKVCLDCDQGG
jgi:RNA polymerase sigma-70 factor (ECF subfamily)